ncbi:hypothetical protein SUTH_02946 [Sulfuritalea hydrogenivorans sk43H]|uniref:Transmembrane protein n=2 Tax=Sulfuritalea hydrogenivorans TaxID=748811 RepID=W0SIF8_9PROT|nr:hypothetical protein SUTH_02946 [Sulfuritalea hydrogenivorans sk43H]
MKPFSVAHSPMPTKPLSKNKSDSRPSRFTRRGEIDRLMRKLEWDGYPRLQMFLLVALTGGAGLLASFVLLHSGIEPMYVRYPVAVGCAYLVFLFLLWLWLRTKADDYVDGSFDLPDISSGGGCGSGVDAAPEFGGGAGGQFGGGGASGNFVVDDSLPSPSLPIGDGGVGSVGEAVGEVVGGADEGAIPLAVALLIAALVAVLLFATIYIVYLAPALFAELLVDGALSASLYRRMRGLQTRHWLESALHRTAVPFTITAVGLALIGYALHAYAPAAHTLGEVLRHFRMPES